jgi:hypothetical protein
MAPTSTTKTRDKQMTSKLEELKAAADAADAAWDAAWAAGWAASEAAWAAYRAARDAYKAELKKTQKEQTNDPTP